jgi:hypothetical protein
LVIYKEILENYFGVDENAAIISFLQSKTQEEIGLHSSRGGSVWGRENFQKQSSVKNVYRASLEHWMVRAASVLGLGME